MAKTMMKEQFIDLKPADVNKDVDIEQLERQLKAKGVEFILTQFVEMYGVAKAKLVPIERLKVVALDGAGFAGFAAGEVGQGPHDPDFVAVPDLHSVSILPWQRNLATSPSYGFVEGQPSPYCPRVILRRMFDRAKALGFTFMTGPEIEFFLVRKNGSSLVLADSLDDSEKPCYNAREITRNIEFLANLSKYQNELGWGNYANDHEDANGQFESNFTFADAMTTADRFTFYRWMVGSLAEKMGCMATFMPKPFQHLTGSSGNYHMSLWDTLGGRNLFIDPADPKGFGISNLGYNFLGGLKEHSRAYCAVTSPTVNSYKRLVKTEPRSGTTWAPVYVSYGGNNRTQQFRIPESGRIEDRTPDASCNPYLSAAVLLAAGLDGIKRKLDPGEPNQGNTYRYSDEELDKRKIKVLPNNLREAVLNFAEDKVLKDALGEKFHSMYIGVKLREWDSYHRSVSQWEIDKYSTLF